MKTRPWRIEACGVVQAAADGVVRVLGDHEMRGVEFLLKGVELPPGVGVGDRVFLQGHVGAWWQNGRERGMEVLDARVYGPATGLTLMEEA